MIMMGPKKDKGAMIVSIMEKFKKPDIMRVGKSLTRNSWKKVDMILPMNIISLK